MFIWLLLAVNNLLIGPHDLEFGRRQVDQFICDRPDVASVINDNPTLRHALEMHFAGVTHGSRVYWDNSRPVSGRGAESYSGCVAVVRVSRAKSISPTDKCASLMFELLNLQSKHDFHSLHLAASGRRISRDDYATRCVRLEYAALKKAHEFFCTYPLANANFQNDSFYCGVFLHNGDFSDYVHYLDGLDGGEYDPREYFKRAYDTLDAVR